MNPIKTVNGRTISRSPSSYLWKLNDVSASNSGRTEDTVMQKRRIGQVVGIELSWNGVPTSVASEILQAFDPEYLTIEYLDPKAGGYVTSEFYVGDRSVPMYSEYYDLWSNISFNIIKRSAR